MAVRNDGAATKVVEADKAWSIEQHAIEPIPAADRHGTPVELFRLWIGANINYVTGHAIFEATHGTAPKYANLDQVNPGSVVLSGEMMLRYMGWKEAADLIIKGMDGAIAAKTVTYDFARQMANEGVTGITELKCSEFGDAIIKHF